MILEKVRAAIVERALFEPREKVVVGVSGGPDSLALLHMLRMLAPEFGLQLHVAHLNHQLRGGDSDADAAFVAEQAAAWGLPATIESRPVAAFSRRENISIEEAARVIRYRFLAEVARLIGARSIAVGHNADDQVETVIMHFMRGSGLAGLRGMLYKAGLPLDRPSGSDVDAPLFLVRPLLDVTRSEIESYCSLHGLRPRIDASNLDTSLFRNRLRHQVIPYLERFNPNLRQVITHSAAAIADDYDYLHQEVERIMERAAHRVNGAYVLDRSFWQDLSPSMQRAVLRETIRRLRRGLRNINWIHIEEARRVGLEGTAGAEVTLPQGLMLVVGYDELTIGETVPRPDWPLLFDEAIRLVPDAAVVLPGSVWQVRLALEEPRQSTEEEQPARREADRWTAQLDAGCIRGPMALRTRRPGDRFQPVGLDGHAKTLHDFMINEKIPRHLRDHLPLLVDEEKILWVCGYRVDERVKVTAETRRVLTVDFQKG